MVTVFGGESNFLSIAEFDEGVGGNVFSIDAFGRLLPELKGVRIQYDLLRVTRCEIAVES